MFLLSFGHFSCSQSKHRLNRRRIRTLGPPQKRLFGAFFMHGWPSALHKHAAGSCGVWGSRAAARGHWAHLSWTTSALSLRQVCHLLWGLSALWESPAGSHSSLCTSYLICMVFPPDSRLSSNCSHSRFESSSEGDLAAHPIVSSRASTFACGCFTYSQCFWMCLLIGALLSLVLSGHLLGPTGAQHFPVIALLGWVEHTKPPRLMKALLWVQLLFCYQLFVRSEGEKLVHEPVGGF